MDIPQIAAAADENFVRHATWVPIETPGMSVSDDGQLAVIDSGLPCDTFNFVCRARLSVGTAPERAQAAARYFREVRRPFSWWIGPADRPDTLGEILETLGLQRAETELAMAIDLADFQPPEPTTGVTVRRVQSAAQLSQFARMLAALWTPPDPHVVTFYTRGASRLLAAESPQRCYVAYVNGEAVGTVEMTVGGGVVGLYNIATAEAYRRRGIGTLLTAYPLAEARSEGVAVGVLQAAAAGVRIYERVGFRRFGGITEYKPPASWFGNG